MGSKLTEVDERPVNGFPNLRSCKILTLRRARGWAATGTPEDANDPQAPATMVRFEAKALGRSRGCVRPMERRPARMRRQGLVAAGQNCGLRRRAWVRDRVAAYGRRASLLFRLPVNVRALAALH